ncbi:MAG TPA: DUF1800 family protein, partial [Phnomibacter sp.]|nr:DUF1800 family protein [Phnomibacter sp.]
IEPMANTLMQTNYSLQAAVTQLLSSLHFYDEDDGIKGDTLWGAKVKDPLELSLGIFRQFAVVIPNYDTQHVSNHQFFNSRIFSRLGRLDLPFWRPFDVSGYPPHSKDPQYDRTWITPITLSARYTDFIDALITGYTHTNVRIQLDTVLFVRNSGFFSDPADADKLLNEFYDMLFVARPQGGRHTYFREALLGGLSIINWRNDWNNYLATNNKNTVKVALDRLVKTLLKSIEYQAS